MSGELVRLEDVRAEREASAPHLTGEAKCLACKHVWTAVAPVGVTSALSCPECAADRGAFMGALSPPGGYVWRCDCGNDTFNLTPAGPFCLGCGDDVRGWP